MAHSTTHRALALLAIWGGMMPVARADPAPRFESTLRHPLFSPTRRPPTPEAAPVAAEAPALPPLPPPSLVLSGIITGGGRGVALLRRPQDAAPIRLALGGQVDGWTVAEIHARSVVLRRDARSVTVDLPQPQR